MPVDAIGQILSTNDNGSVSNSTLNQEDFLRLFLTELNFQDPLEPVDNKEFLAQMAQFASIEQSRQSSENINNLVTLSSIQQTVGLLNKVVTVNTEAGPATGIAFAIRVDPEVGTVLSLKHAETGAFLGEHRLSQVNNVTEKAQN